MPETASVLQASTEILIRIQLQRETRPKIWAYLLWKQTQFQNKLENEGDNPWKLYQTWMQMEETTRQSWLVAGGTIQSFERVSEG